MHQWHCEQLMTHHVIALIHGGKRHEYLCTICGQHEREIRTERGTLVTWKNLSAKNRLAAAQSVSV